MTASATQRGKIITCSERKESSEGVWFYAYNKSSLRSSHIKNDKTVDAKEHFYVSRCLLLATKIHNKKSRYFSSSDRSLQNTENRN